MLLNHGILYNNRSFVTLRYTYAVEHGDFLNSVVHLIPMPYAVQLCDFLTLYVCGISMPLNYDIFCSFRSKYFLKTHTKDKEFPHIHQHCQLICFRRLGKTIPKHEATLPPIFKKKICKVAKTQIVCGSLVPVSACTLKTITHLYHNCSWNYLSSNLKSGQLP